MTDNWPVIDFDNPPEGGPITDPVELARRREAFALDLASDLARGKVQYIGVFPVERGELGYHFAYTVGRAAKGLPELFVTGMSSTAEGFLTFVEEHWGEHPGPGIPWPVGNQGGQIMTLTLPRWVRDEHLTLARRIGGEDFEALQVVWTDDDGRWPWELPPIPPDDPRGTKPTLGVLP